MEFKDTKIERLPKEWEVAPVSDIFEVITGTTPSTKILDYWENGTINWFTPADMTDITGQAYLAESSRKITKRGVEETILTVMPAGSLIISTRAPVGYVGILKAESAFNQGCKGLMPKKDKKISPEFYYFYLSLIQKKLQNMSGGSTFMELGKDAFERCLIIYPPLPEQQKIAEILSTVDSAIQKSDEILAKTERMKRGLMQKLLTEGIGHKEFKDTELGRLPKEWEVFKIREVCDKIMSGGTPNTSSKEYYNGNIRFVKIEDITNAGKYLTTTAISISEDGLNNSNAWLVPQNSVLLAIYGSMGATTINRIQVATNQAILGIIPKKNQLGVEYLYYWFLFSNRSFLRHAKRSTQANLTLGIIENLKLPLPPLPEQQKIAEILSTIDGKLEQERKRKEKLERVKKGMMNELLTGRKRVRGELDE